MSWRGGLSASKAYSHDRGYQSISKDVFETSVPGKIITELSASDVDDEKVSGLARISNFRLIASYNWLDRSEPTILVPGAPAVWSPPAEPRRLQPDSGRVFVDQNAARCAASPMEPMFRALYEAHPRYDFDDHDAVLCRNCMGKLFDYVSSNSKDFEMDVEIVDKVAIFVRKEKKSTETIVGFRGFGHTFPEEYTGWEADVKGSSAHHRIAQFELAGSKYLLRFESDAYIPTKTSQTKTQSPEHLDENKVGMDALISLPDSAKVALNIDEKQPSTASRLEVRREGHYVEQDAVAEIKTRAAYKTLDMDGVLPRLWISQTPNLIVGYYKKSQFNDVRVQDMRDDVKKWEEQNEAKIKKLSALIKMIIGIVQKTASKKCRLRNYSSGKLQIWELDTNYQSALPSDLCAKIRGDDAMMKLKKPDPYIAETTESSEDDDHYDSDYDHNVSDDTSLKDFTACSSLHCGNCGHCDY
ncbi:MAG: hypothetical protein M1825_005510 [Sarcosagium campestre]|nr:MAG: hypothetical protein M1825_005510 [Sarcosagium campestre]